jgi:hypothetical protein
LYEAPVEDGADSAAWGHDVEAEREMILGLIGRLFRLAARFHAGDSSRDLDHVGEELIRLDRRRRQPRATSR